MKKKRLENHILSKTSLIMLLIVLAIFTLFFAESVVADDEEYLYVPGEYDTIQDAVDNSSDGDIIVVSNGVYRENVDVNRRVSIVSTEGATYCTVEALDDSMPVFSCSANGIIVDGFKITGSTAPGWGSGILVKSNDCIIKNNILTANRCGIFLYYVQNNSIINNQVLDAIYYGIRLYYSSGNLIENDTCVNCDSGINLYQAHENQINNNEVSLSQTGILIDFSNNNDLSNNTCSEIVHNGISIGESKNTHAQNNFVNQTQIALYLYNADESIIRNNTLTHNSQFGMYMRHSDTNKIIFNLIDSNGWDGIYLLEYNSNNTISNNIIYNNTKGIIDFPSSNEYNSIDNNTCYNNTIGIKCSSSNLEIKDNICNDNDWYGIYVESDDNIILSNSANNNEDTGIYFAGSNGNLIKDNRCKNNENYGLYLGISHQNQIIGNHLKENKDHGIYLRGSNNNTLQNNLLAHNDLTGIFLSSASIYSSNDNIVEDNQIHNHSSFGIWTTGFRNHIINNTFSHNAVAAINNGKTLDLPFEDYHTFLTVEDNHIDNSLEGITFLSTKLRNATNILSNNTFSNVNKKILQDWTMYIKIINEESLPLENAFIEILDNDNDTLLEGYTNMDGYFTDPSDNQGIDLCQYYYSSYDANISENPYIIRITKDSTTISKTLHIENNAEEIIIFNSYDLYVSESDIISPLFIDGRSTNINVTIHKDTMQPIDDITVSLVINGVYVENKTIDLPENITLFNLSFTIENFTWTIEEFHDQSPTIEIVIDEDNSITETDETNNIIVKTFPFKKGIKKSSAEQKGYIITNPRQTMPYVVPIAIWYEDDALTSENGLPTRHYNPIACSEDVLNDIDQDFNGDQFTNGKTTLDFFELATNPTNIIPTYWERSSGLILCEETLKTGLGCSPIASYLNWPMLPIGCIDDENQFTTLIDLLNINYVLVFAQNQSTLNLTIDHLNEISFQDNQILFIKPIACEDNEGCAPTDVFHTVLHLYGDESSSIIITNSREDSSLASAPLAAFYNSMILDVEDIIQTPLSYSSDTFASLSPYNALVQTIMNGSGLHSILGYVLSYQMSSREKTVYLVGSDKYIPYAIVKEPLPGANNAIDSDKDWIATDHPYYHSYPSIIPGGRMMLSDSDNLDYIAMALQFNEIPLGSRARSENDWEHNILGAGIYNPNGKRYWPGHLVWWMDSIAYHLRDLAMKSLQSNIHITSLYEDASVHNGGWGENWWRYDNRWGTVQKAPVFYDQNNPLQNPNGSGNRGDNTNNDNDLIGSENNDGRYPIELIRDNNANGVYDPGVDDIINEGLKAGINCLHFSPFIDEEIWDGFDNDGDGLIDEDCSYWKLCEVENVYNETHAETTMPDIDENDFIDLIDTNLIPCLSNQSIIMYSGHSWTDNWYMANIGGNNDPDVSGPIPPKTSDNRTSDEITLHASEIPQMSPSTVIACSCGSSRTWEPDCICEAFLRKGALSYTGSTAIAYGSSDEFRQQMLNQIHHGRLHIGSSFKYAVDNLDQNDLWAKRFDENNNYAGKTRYEFNLYGLGSTEIDPGDSPTYVTYNSPILDTDESVWMVNITLDFPEVTEHLDANGNITAISPSYRLLSWFSDNKTYPKFSLLPFQYTLPVGSRLTELRLLDTKLSNIYNFSQPLATDFSKELINETPLNQPLNDIIEDTALNYNGSLFPDILFVHNTTYDPNSNVENIMGSCSMIQVNGTLNQTMVYDKIMLQLRYTSPILLNETHVVDGSNLTVNLTLRSLDGETHHLIPHCHINTIGGIDYRSLRYDEQVINAEEKHLSFTINNISLASYIVQIMLHEQDQLMAEIMFEVSPCGCDPDLSLPFDNITMYAWEFPSDLFGAYRIELDDIAGAYNVSDGSYPGWCVDYGTPIPKGSEHPHNLTLYSSYDPPTHLAHENWPRVNYLINHIPEDASAVDVQRAIYYLINFGPWSWDFTGYDPMGNVIDYEVVNSIIENATFYGKDFCPGCGDKIAVICDPGVEHEFQITFIEVVLCSAFTDVVDESLNEPVQDSESSKDAVTRLALPDSENPTVDNEASDEPSSNNSFSDVNESWSVLENESSSNESRNNESSVHSEDTGGSSVESKGRNDDESSEKGISFLLSSGFLLVFSVLVLIGFIVDYNRKHSTKKNNTKASSK